MTNFVLRSDQAKAYAIGEITKLQVDAEKPLEVIVREFKKKRSLGQNALLHVWCQEIAYVLTERSQELFTPEYIKTQIKRRFGLVDTRECPITGILSHYLVSTAEYTTEQLSETLIKAELWCQDIDIDLSHKGCKTYAEYREARL